MQDFRLLGRIEKLGEDQFLAIVSAVPEQLGPDARALVEQACVPTHGEAWRQLEALAVNLGRMVRERGGRVIQIEIE